MSQKSFTVLLKAPVCWLNHNNHLIVTGQIEREVSQLFERQELPRPLSRHQ